MKNKISFLLLAVFVFNMAGFIPILMYRLADIKSLSFVHMKQAEELKNTIEIQISSKEFRLYYNSKEQEYTRNSKLYDVLSYSFTSCGEVVLHCIADSAESELMLVLNEIEKKNSGSGNEKDGKSFSKILSGAFLNMDPTFTWNVQEITKEAVDLNCNLCFFYPDISGPPPKMI